METQHSALTSSLITPSSSQDFHCICMMVTIQGQQPSVEASFLSVKFPIGQVLCQTINIYMHDCKHEVS